MTKKKRVYLCSVAWDHEVGHTMVEAYSSPKHIEHIGCGIVACDLSLMRTVKKEDFGVKGATIPASRMDHEMRKSLRAKIKELQMRLKRLEEKK